MAINIETIEECGKLPWSKPELNVVATTSEIAGGVGIDDDEDFTGLPVPS